LSGHLTTGNPEFFLCRKEISGQLIFQSEDDEAEKMRRYIGVAITGKENEVPRKK